jgi:hypothetical protein
MKPSTTALVGCPLESTATAVMMSVPAGSTTVVAAFGGEDEAALLGRAVGDGVGGG